ncbi:type I 3-dehydroquinate dehydratase [Desulfurobacterium sp.]
MYLGTVKLGEAPRVILATDDRNLEEKLFKARELKVDLIEARIDLLENPDKDRIRTFLDTIGDFGFYAVATIRPVWEGGNFKGTEDARLELLSYAAGHPAVAAVDVELRAENIKKRAITLIKSFRKKVILSYHDFDKTPPVDEIHLILKRMQSDGGDIAKCAFKANSFKDIAETACVMKASQMPVIFMLMGEYGKISRVDGFCFGSLLSYTFSGKPVAPGQIEVEKLIKLLAEFYPEYRKEKFKLDLKP